MSKIKKGGLDQYGTELFEQQQFGTAGVEGVKYVNSGIWCFCGCYDVTSVKCGRSHTDKTRAVS